MKLALINRIERMNDQDLVVEATRIINQIDSKPRKSRQDLIERLAVRNSWRSGNRDYFGSLSLAARVYAENS